MDDAIIILSNTKTIQNLYSYMYQNELIANTCLIDPNKTELINYMEFVGKTNINVTPIKLNWYSNKYLKPIYFNGLIFSLFFIITTIFVLINITINVLQLVDSNIKEYSIHLLYGARYKDIYIRTLFYILLIILLPSLLGYNIMNNFFHIKLLPLPMLILFFLCYLLLTAYLPIKLLKSKNLTDYMGRNE